MGGVERHWNEDHYLGFLKQSRAWQPKSIKNLQWLYQREHLVWFGCHWDVLNVSREGRQASSCAYTSILTPTWGAPCVLQYTHLPLLIPDWAIISYQDPQVQGHQVKLCNFITTGHGDAKSYKHSTVGPQLILHISTWWTHCLVYLDWKLGLHSSLHTKGRFHLPKAASYWLSFFLVWGAGALSWVWSEETKQLHGNVSVCVSPYLPHANTGTSCSPQLSAVQLAH